MPKSQKSASVAKMVAGTSRSWKIQREPFNSDVETIIQDNIPVSLLDDPDQIVNHEQIPEKIRVSVIDGFGKDYFYNRQWTLAEVKRLNRVIVYPRENLTNSIAQICSPNCTIKDTCPYDILGEAPVSNRCPVELKLAKLLTDEYNHAVAERHKLNVEDIETDIVYYNLIRGLVEADIVENRLNSALSRDGFTQDTPTAVNEETGEVFYKKEESVAVRIKDRVNQRKDKLYQQLIASPEMVAKYKIKSENDAMSRLLDVVEKLEKTALLGENVVDAEIIDE